MASNQTLTIVLVLICVAATATTSAGESGAVSSLPGPNDYVRTYPDAEMVYYQEPVYPDQSKQAGHKGRAEVKALIDSKGVVRDAIIYSSSGYPLLDKAALDAAPLCRWKPGCTDGWPVASWAKYEVKFSLNEKSVGAPQQEPESIAILVCRETGYNKESKLPIGKLWLWGGFNKGIDSGMTGIVRRRNDITGWVTVADVAVEWVNGTESRCSFVMTNREFALREWDRVSLTVAQPSANAILERGLAAHSAGQFDNALSFLDDVWCLARTNDFVRQVTELCRERTEAWRSTDISANQLLEWRRYKNDFLRTAEFFIERRNYHEAERHLQRVLLVDSVNSIALGLRDSLPDIDYYADKTNWCNRYDSLLAGTAMPLVDEFIPYDSLAEFISGDSAVYPDVGQRKFGTTSVDILTDKTGAAVDAVIKTSSGDKLFDDAALRCARSRKYRPAYAQGQPMASWVELTVRFSP